MTYNINNFSIKTQHYGQCYDDVESDKESNIAWDNEVQASEYDTPSDWYQGFVHPADKKISSDDDEPEYIDFIPPNEFYREYIPIKEEPMFQPKTSQIFAAREERIADFEAEFSKERSFDGEVLASMMEGLISYAANLFAIGKIMVGLSED